ncbi:carboxypeptidase-like regulatory domain-containing protein [Nonlabens tegetincola]|uniref:carboxypeptidase-like regulatory domain-containing protein n=1 Tax=Nonlabens tegetincola TaxID=323273 RepID=UPI0030C7EFE1
MKAIINIGLLLFSVLLWSQNNRTQIEGKILSATEEPLSGITIFNNNSIDGTVTNDDGIFYLNVKAGDKLTLRAVQYEPLTLVVTEQTVEDKKATIQLRQGVNILDEVVINESLMLIDVKEVTNVDPKIDEVSEFNVRTRAVDRIDNTFSDRQRQPEEYAIRHEAMAQSMPRFNMFNLVGLLGAVVLNSTLSALDLNSGPVEEKKEFDVILIKNKYQTKFLTEFLKLEEKYLYEFMYYAKDRGLNEEMFSKQNELDLLQFLNMTATEFKRKKNLPDYHPTESTQETNIQVDSMSTDSLKMKETIKKQ